MQSVGVPIDTEAMQACIENWDGIKNKLIADIDSEYGVFEGQTFKASLWEGYLRLAHWQKSTFKFKVYLWPFCLDAGTHQTKARARAGLY